MKLNEFRQACGNYGVDEFLHIHLADGRSGLLIGDDVMPADDSGSVTLRVNLVTEEQISVPLSAIVHVEARVEWENRQAQPVLATLFQYTFGGRAAFEGRGPLGLMTEAAKALHYQQHGKAQRCMLGSIALTQLVSEGVLTADVAATFTAPYRVEIEGRKATVCLQHKSGALVTTVVHF